MNSGYKISKGNIYLRLNKLIIKTIERTIIKVSLSPKDEYRIRLGMIKYNKTSFSFLKNLLNHKNVANKISLFAKANEVTVMKFGKGIAPRIFDANITALVESSL